MNKKQLLYHGSLLVTIWFEYFIVVSIIAMFIYHKDLKTELYSLFYWFYCSIC